MTAAAALAKPARVRTERRRAGRGRVRTPLPRTAEVVTLWAVSCCVCSRLSMAYRNRERALTPSKTSGWRYRIISGVGGWFCDDCNGKYELMLPPPTRGDCMGGARPCRALLCKWNLWFDTSRKAHKGFKVLQTCALDVADEGAHTLRDIGAMLGMTREGSRYIELAGLAVLRQIPGLAYDFEDDVDDDGGDGRP